MPACFSQTFLSRSAPVPFLVLHYPQDGRSGPVPGSLPSLSAMTMMWYLSCYLAAITMFVGFFVPNTIYIDMLILATQPLRLRPHLSITALDSRRNSEHSIPVKFREILHLCVIGDVVWTIPFSRCVISALHESRSYRLAVGPLAPPTAPTAAYSRPRKKEKKKLISPVSRAHAHQLSIPCPGSNFPCPHLFTRNTPAEKNIAHSILHRDKLNYHSRLY
jgi:hypothetical protein